MLHTTLCLSSKIAPGALLYEPVYSKKRLVPVCVRQCACDMVASCDNFKLVGAYIIGMLDRRVVKHNIGASTPCIYGIYAELSYLTSNNL